MRVLQASYQVPLNDKNDQEVVGYAMERVTRMFADQLVRDLGESTGGVIISPVRTTVKHDKDFLFDTPFATVRVYANVVDLPEPPEYRLVGGPADGHIVRTNGDRYWLVPIYTPPVSVASLADPQERVRHLVAEYERQDLSSAYFYKRTYEH